MNLSGLIYHLNNNFTHNINKLFPILLNYKGNDWIKYKKHCVKGYNRTKIYSNTDYDLILINWSKESKSKIHDHSDNGCVFKVLEGKLCEHLYEPNTLKYKQTNIFKNNELSYINDIIGYHSIENIYIQNSYSLHLYIPSNYITNYYD